MQAKNNCSIIFNITSLFADLSKCRGEEQFSDLMQYLSVRKCIVLNGECLQFDRYHI